MPVKYFNEDAGYRFRDKRLVARWIGQTIASEGMETGYISIIFCSDDYLLRINRQYLNHDYFTDIITFDCRDGYTLSGDLFISVDTVRENAREFGIPFQEEIRRVVIHGILHLCGYKDKTEAEAKTMRMKENHYLSVLKKQFQQKSSH